MRRKYPWWSGFVVKIKKIILPRMFPWKSSRNFQNNYFVEHFPFLISYSVLAEWQLSISFLDTYVFSEYFFTSVRVTLGLLAINVEKTLRWRLQSRLFFCVLFFLLFLCLLGSYYQENFRFNQSINFKKSESKLTWHKAFLCSISLSAWGW